MSQPNSNRRTNQTPLAPRSIFNITGSEARKYQGNSQPSRGQQHQQQPQAAPRLPLGASPSGVPPFSSGTPLSSGTPSSSLAVRPQPTPATTSSHHYAGGGTSQAPNASGGQRRGGTAVPPNMLHSMNSGSQTKPKTAQASSSSGGASKSSSSQGQGDPKKKKKAT